MVRARTPSRDPPRDPQRRRGATPSRLEPWLLEHGLPLLLLAVLVVVAYGPTLGAWFTGPDVFSLIYTSRLQGPADLWRILTQPLMPGRLTSFGRFFRPVTNLSYALDWAVWGFHPWGYHLTNLLLHLAATLLTYGLGRAILPGGRWHAAAGAALFSLHPAVSESIPAISRRQDALATVFLLAALLAYLRAWRGPRRHRAWFAASLGLTFLAVGAKEVAGVLPGLVLAHAWLVDVEAPGGILSRERARWALGRALPFIGVVALFAAWHTAVLGGAGGYTNRSPWLSRDELWVLGGYLTVIVYPVRTVAQLLHLATWQIGIVWTLLALGALVAVLLRFRGGLDRIPGALQEHLATPRGRARGFLVVWILGGAVLFLAARIFEAWSAYLFLVPAGLLPVALLPPTLAAPRAGRARRAGTGVVLALALVTVAVSPALAGDPGWTREGQVLRTTLRGFDGVVVVHGEARTSVVRVHQAPWHLGTSGAGVGQAQTVFCFQEYTFQDYLLLRHGPSARTDVRIASLVDLSHDPGPVAVLLLRVHHGVSEVRIATGT